MRRFALEELKRYRSGPRGYKTWEVAEEGNEEVA